MDGARRRRRRGGWGAGRGCTAGEGSGEGAVPPPQKIFDYLILKCRILMHISGILTYFFKVLLCNVKQNTVKLRAEAPVFYQYK